jgi:hypothetical protein
MANAKAQHELVGVLVNKYPRLAVRLAEVAGEPCPAYERVAAGPNTHQVRREGKRGQVMSDATVHLLRDEEKCHFFQVEMQRDYSWSKLATLRAYHGSEVRNAECGGHVFVLSPRAAVTESFLRAEKEAGTRLAFSASYLTGRDLAPLAAAERPFEERALAAAVTDLSRGITDQTVLVLLEMREHDDTVADLFLTAILEECPDEGELEAKLSDLAMQRLQSLPSFQRWAARTSERIRAEVTAEVEAERAKVEAERAKIEAKIEAEVEARVRAAMEVAAEERTRVAQEAAVSQAREVVHSLQSYFSAKGDAPSLGALETMNACTSMTTARYWLNRAYAGETCAEIFADGNDTK